ncbi:hypothetical protein [Streptomyces sp. NPDC057689]|uniref:hypothetical protein n=1 Tax=Streptomyces sp. NPDC057689 TaxID=3346213 RepID=UPI0036965847
MGDPEAGRTPTGPAPAPGDGYRIEIDSVRKVLAPLEESVVAAHKIKRDWNTLSAEITESADFDIVGPARTMLEKWGFGMGRVAEDTDVVVETLRVVLAAYVLADLLCIENFSPTAANIAKLPFGEEGMKAWQEGSRPKFDPPPEIYQEPWLDDGDSGSYQDVPRHPRLRVDGGWEVDGGSSGKGPVI